MGEYLKNCWYQAAWADELTPGAMLARTICEMPLVLFRDSEGNAAALHDRCPHRFAPLSRGMLSGGGIACGYHGLAFGADGGCVHNPHGPITRALAVRAFPLVERHLALWVWLGDAALADPALLPDLSFIDDTPEVARIAGYVPTRANHQLLADNILDLSHADYLHATTLGGFNSAARTSTRAAGDGVVVDWYAQDIVPPPAFRATLHGAERADIWQEVMWRAPGVMVLTVAPTPAGVPRTPADEGLTLHNMVPETATTTHYFYCLTRRFRTDDTEFTAFLRGAVNQAFADEDKPMLEAQQARIGDADIASQGPALLKIDAAATLARRKLAELIARENTNG